MAAKEELIINRDVSGGYCKTAVSRRSDALEWWDKVDRFAMLKKYGYQDEKKPWKYRPLTDKGIYLMWCRENGGQRFRAWRSSGNRITKLQNIIKCRKKNKKLKKLQKPLLTANPC